MDLAADLPVDAEYQACGTIWVAADDEEMAEVERKNRLYGDIGVRAEVLGPDALAEAEPNLRKGLAGGLLVHDDAIVNPPSAAGFLLERAQSRGAVVRTGEAVAEMSGEGMKLRDGTFIPAGFTLNATGAWAPSLTPGIDVRKRKGHLVITERHPGFVRHQLVELGYLKSAHSIAADSVAFNVQPRLTGQVVIGSSRQYGAEDSGVDAPIVDRMLERAQEYMPALAKLGRSVAGWAFEPRRRTNCLSSVRARKTSASSWRPGTRGWESRRRSLRAG
jgi:glycine/D-amino acid oxidase-like deaminating enzyme